ncbi:MAG TPA: BamA/TamA family outer membrane protein [Ignavibacteriaceae bacterium]|nr:BamA/TamA family outer membrane protein [Ignavibacteriaceae bacterium]HRP92956.1 BamA/TamA family outer membrane protein [Ignavibacteriaceae bacterium]HRQ54514.1 BamA/TamA family outer membrane protein [Ignavibacteriaceae bacterium]
MTRLAKFSFAIVILISSLISAQKLSSFDVTGNFNFDDSEYLRWSELRINQPIYNGIIDSVKSKIAKNILLQGYYFFKFNRDSLVISSDSSTFKIILDIDEGNPVVVRNIFFEGIDSTEIPNILSQFEYLKGQIFNKQEIERNIQQLLSRFENSGYPFAKIKINSVNVYRDTLTEDNYADIHLNIISGDLNKIDKVDVRGNTSTKDYVIIRELRLEAGEPYMQNRIEEFPNRLNRLRFFEPVSIPQFYINSKNEGVLLVEVKEKNTNNFDGIIGYIPPGKNEDSGYLTGLVNISLRNLFGTGRAAAIKWNKYNRDSQELNLKYLEPWLLSFPVNINLELYQRVQDTTYVQRKFEGSLEYLATEDISASLILASETVVPTVRTIPVFTVFNSSYLTTGANLKIDTRDDPYSPTKGLLFVNSYSFSRKTINGPLEYITPNLETSVDLQRFESSFSLFHELFTRQIIAVSVNVKELRGSTFENSDLYRLGGTNSLRGYREEQFLGSRIFWSNLEYRTLLTRRSYGFVFFDTGYYLRPEDVEKNIQKSEEFLYGFGLGLSLETALGVLRVSYALGEGDTFSDGKIHFGILNEF